MEYQVIYAPKALEDLFELENNIAKRIKEKITFFRRQENPLHYAKKLKNTIFGTYRFRIGDYRAIFDVDHQGMISVLHILLIKHRKEIYQLES